MTDAGTQGIPSHLGMGSALEAYICASSIGLSRRFDLSFWTMLFTALLILDEVRRCGRGFCVLVGVFDASGQ